jgi:hypothetical protein
LRVSRRDRNKQKGAGQHEGLRAISKCRGNHNPARIQRPEPGHLICPGWGDFGAKL